MKISNLGKSALVGLGLSCGVAATQLTRINQSGNETLSLPEKCFERINNAHNETLLAPEENFMREDFRTSPLVKRDFTINDITQISAYSVVVASVLGIIIGIGRCCFGECWEYVSNKYGEDIDEEVPMALRGSRCDKEVDIAECSSNLESDYDNKVEIVINDKKDIKGKQKADYDVEIDIADDVSSVGQTSSL